MEKAARSIIQTAVVEQIKKRHQVTNQEIADSIGVHMSHIQKVSKGVRTLSDFKLDELCAYWKINLKDLVDRMTFNDTDYYRRKTIVMVLNARQIEYAEISKATGITPIDLNQLQRTAKSLSDEEMEKLADYLQIDSEILTEGLIALVFEMMEQGLNRIHMPPAMIKAGMEFFMQGI